MLNNSPKYLLIIIIRCIFPPFVLIIFQYCFPILTKYLNLNEHLALSPSPSSYLSSFSLKTREVNRLITDKLSLSLSLKVLNPIILQSATLIIPTKQEGKYLTLSHENRTSSSQPLHLLAYTRCKIYTSRI